MKLPKYYESYTTFHEGTMPDRAYYIPYGCEKAALTSHRKDSNRFVDLEGEWSFGYYENPEAVPESVICSDFDLAKEGYVSMPVPSNWQLHGFGQNQYVNHNYPIPFDPPYVPYENPTGVYVREFELSEDIADMNKYLLFEGVDSCYFVWVNGEYVGYSQVSHATSEFDISAYAKTGTNRIVVVVLKYSDGTYFEDQDKLRMSGIFRSVYVLARPKAHLRDFFAAPVLSEDYTCGQLEVEGEFIGDACMSLKLLSPQGELVAEGKISASDNKAVLQVPEAILWTAESPNLYTLILSSPDEVIVQKIGMREICRKGDVIYLNGKKIKLKGVNRHDTNPYRGFAVTEEDMLTDLRLMKEHNVNAIRTSHYPNSPLFVEMCDKYGFYVISESDIETHGSSDIYNDLHESSTYNYFADDPRYFEAIMDRIRKNVIRDKNSAAVVIWSLANEAGFGSNFEYAAKWIREYDKTRLVHYTEAMFCSSYYPEDVTKAVVLDIQTTPRERGVYDRSNLDFYSTMYADCVMIENYLKGDYEKMSRKGKMTIANEEVRHLPFIQSEMAHASENSPGDLEEYYELMYRYDNFVGQFIWEWADHAVYDGKTTEGKEKFLYGGDFGDFPNNGNGCVDGLVYPNRKPHTGLLELKNVARPVRMKEYDLQKGTFTFRNMLDFTDLMDLCDIVCEIRKDGEVLSTEKFENISCAPYEYVTLTISKEVPCEPHVSVMFYYIQKKDMAFTPAGYVLGFDQALVECPVEVVEKVYAAQEAPVVTESDDEIVITAKDESFRYVFRKHLATFESIVKKNVSYITKPMEYNIWRAPIGNDKFIKTAWEAARYYRAKTKVYETGWEMEGACVIIRAKLSIVAVSMQRILSIDATYKVTPDGAIEIDLDAMKTPIMPYLPRFGMRMMFPERFENVEYYGYGPYESYIDKRKASYLDKFETTVDDLHEDYVTPQENGSHYGCEYVKLSDGYTTITASSGNTVSFNASHYTQEELTEKAHSFEIQKSGLTVLCLDGAHSGIGSSSCGPYLLEELRVEGGPLAFKCKLEFGK